MPWREICRMDARMKFVGAVRAGEDSMTALCEEYGVSRRVGYKWLARYVAEGPCGLQERRPGPRRVPWAITPAQAEAIVGLRRQHPSWGTEETAR
jgi:transposase